MKGNDRSMQREITFDRLEQFVAQIQTLGITSLAFAETREKRAVQVEPSLLKVIDIVKTDILAYKDSTIYKCSIEETSPDDLFEDLAARGFTIKRRSRNIT
ncbi:MAG: hypothetical protein EPN93_02135 [Spirochaetes bacterium]|nr:MAG: hypothetical protein EPN93_02135 [Spirochaetota bacterium]